MEICKMWELGTRVNLKLFFILFSTFEVVLNQSFKNAFLSLFPLLFVFISLFLITFITVFACLPEDSARAEKTQEIEYCLLFGFKRLQLRLTTSTHEDISGSITFSFCSYISYFKTTPFCFNENFKL